MVVRDIAYSELYAKDKQSVVDYFVASMGFAAVADSVEADRTSTLLRQGDVRLVVTAGPATEEFLDRHGDGIADIALVCDDVAAVRASALAAGATEMGPVRDHPVVSGFGDVRHTLLPAARTPEGLPPARPWVAAPASARAGRIRLLDHVAVCVEGPRLAEYADFYKEGFGFARYSSEYTDLGGEQAMDSIVVRGASARVTFTLVAPDVTKNPGQLDAFLSRNGGPGVQHLAFLVDDIAPAVIECRDRGVEFLEIPDSYYDMLLDRFADMRDEVEGLKAAAVLVDRDEWGYLLQLFARSPHERNTLFYEFIQRRGSRGFGASNIKALYEAVDRDRLSA